MDWVIIAYWICFLTGSVYAVISAFLSGFFGGFDGGHGLGHVEIGHDYGAGGAGGHGDVLAVPETGDEPVMGPLSPATLAIFMTTFGGTGIILTSLFKMKLLVSLPLSMLAGVGLAAVIFVTFYRFFAAVQCSSESRVAELAGLRGEVNVPIPPEGVGEVVFICRGNRLSSSARSQDGVDLPRHAVIRIVRMVGNTAYVSLLGEEAPASPPQETPAEDVKD